MASGSSCLWTSWLCSLYWLCSQAGWALGVISDFQQLPDHMHSASSAAPVWPLSSCQRSCQNPFPMVPLEVPGLRTPPLHQPVVECGWLCDGLAWCTTPTPQPQGGGSAAQSTGSSRGEMVPEKKPKALLPQQGTQRQAGPVDACFQLPRAVPSPCLKSFTLPSVLGVLTHLLLLCVPHSG